MTYAAPIAMIWFGLLVAVVAVLCLRKRKRTRMELARQALAADVARRKAAYHAGQKRDARGRFCAHP